MKKIAIVLGVIASVAVLAGCANQPCPCKSTTETTQVTHHDYKGEMATK